MTEFYYKIHQVFYFKMWQIYYKMRQLLQYAKFVTNYDGTTYSTSNLNSIKLSLYPVDTGRKLNVYKTFRRRPGPFERLMYVQFTSCVYWVMNSMTRTLLIEKLYKFRTIKCCFTLYLYPIHMHVLG